MLLRENRFEEIADVLEIVNPLSVSIYNSGGKGLLWISDTLISTFTTEVLV